MDEAAESLVEAPEDADRKKKRRRRARPDEDTFSDLDDLEDEDSDDDPEADDRDIERRGADDPEIDPRVRKAVGDPKQVTMVESDDLFRELYAIGGEIVDHVMAALAPLEKALGESRALNLRMAKALGGVVERIGDLETGQESLLKSLDGLGETGKLVKSISERFDQEDRTTPATRAEERVSVPSSQILEKGGLGGAPGAQTGKPATDGAIGEEDRPRLRKAVTEAQRIVDSGRVVPGFGPLLNELNSPSGKVLVKSLETVESSIAAIKTAAL